MNAGKSARDSVALLGALCAVSLHALEHIQVKREK
jgi:hypothetical protein